jgi:SAM-dependent methyltransferase
MERHRIQYLVMLRLRAERDFSRMSILHIAPEPFFREPFRNWFRRYITADLNQSRVNYRLDLRQLPFHNSSFDCVFASHVLEYIREDDEALSEIRRVLTPLGVAILMVPIVAVTTIEYPGAYEHGHIRAPGMDYFDRYKKHFAKVEILSSNDFPTKHQVFIYEDRSRWPSKDRPFARAMPGERHPALVPICYVGS